MISSSLLVRDAFVSRLRRSVPCLDCTNCREFRESSERLSTRHLYEAERIILEDSPYNSANSVIAITPAGVYEIQWPHWFFLPQNASDSFGWPTKMVKKFTLLRILAADVFKRSRGSLDSMYNILILDKVDVTEPDLNKATDVKTCW